MKLVYLTVFAILLCVQPAFADPDKNESGHGRHYYEHKWNKGKRKEEFYEGNCKVERKWEKKEYKEEVKCKGAPWSHSYSQPPVVHWPVVINVPDHLPPLPAGPFYGEYYKNDGQYCREYQDYALIDGRKQRVYGIACLQPDGSWQFK